MDDDETSISFFGVSQEEGTGETPTQFLFDVVLSNPVQGGLRIDYGTADGSATVADDDYVATNGSLMFVGSENEQLSIEVQVTADGAVERDESFSVSLDEIAFLDPALADLIVIDGGTQEGVVVNDDTATVAFLSDASVAVESTDIHPLPMQLNITGGGTITEELTIQLDILPGGTATTPEDFVLDSNTITFPAGSRDGDVLAVNMMLVSDDGDEGDEQVSFELALVSGGMDGLVTLGPPIEHEVTVTEDPMTSGISGVVWFDADDNGRQDRTEIPIPGVLIDLIGVDLRGQIVEITRMTDEAGAYQFLSLPAGTYSVMQRQPAAFIDGQDVLGEVDGEPVGTVANDRFFSIVVEPDQQGEDYNFGEKGFAYLEMSRRMFFASTPPLEGSIRGLVANGETSAGNVALAAIVQRGAPFEMRRIGSQVLLTGTNQDDLFRFIPAGSSSPTTSANHRVFFNGLEWQFDPDRVDEFMLDAVCGDDLWQVYDSPNDDLLTAEQETATLSNRDFRVDAIAFDLVRAISSSGGEDSVMEDDAEFMLQLEGPWDL